LTPTKAHLLDDGGEREVEAKDLEPGNIVIVRPGDNIPGDGEVIEGESTVNQANITGESLPVDKNVGDDAFGGTINMTGVMKIRITKAGADTTLGRVKDLILQAERTKIPGMRLIERYARWYTPVIMMLAAISFIFTKNLNIAIGLLVVACPCAIILASPTAMVAALSAASRLGVWVKDVADLEKARNLTGIVFDKTGTLTTGVLSVTKLSPVEGVEGVDLLVAASSAEQHSKHPVARAVMDVARKAKLNVPQTDEFEEVPGQGVRVKQNGDDVLVGRATFLEARGVDVSGVDAEGSEGLSLLYAAKNGKVLGWLGLEDKTRGDASGAMNQLRDMGLKKLVMVTGDRWSVAKRVASEMHCTDVQAEVLPGQKLELVDALKGQGHQVAVVGDGVNDAPALAAGDISIAMGAAGSDVAIHSASIALMNNNLNRIPFLIGLSHRTFGVVRQNMIFSVLYIVIMSLLIVLGAFGESTPIVAVICHFLSSFVVVFNSARLVREGENLASMDAHSGEEIRERAGHGPVRMEPVAG
ncbi:MAG: heavy metal translocating P-type ATPase, partial [Planctomycetota bacterium]